MAVGLPDKAFRLWNCYFDGQLGMACGAGLMQTVIWNFSGLQPNAIGQLQSPSSGKEDLTRVRTRAMPPARLENRPALTSRVDFHRSGEALDLEQQLQHRVQVLLRRLMESRTICNITETLQLVMRILRLPKNPCAGLPSDANAVHFPTLLITPPAR